jgi:two-component system sensor histidine kinase/response regulator
MIVECKSCGQKYRIDESKIKGRTARVICKSCGGVTAINRSESEPVPPVPEPVPPDDWEVDMESAPQPESALEPPIPVSPGELMPVEPKNEKEPSEPGEPEKIPIEGTSIRLKITLVIVLLVLISLTVVGFFAGFSSRLALSEQAERHLFQHTLQKSREYGIIFARVQEEVLGVANYSEHVYHSGGFTTDTGTAVLLPWTGSGYGNPAIREKLQDEIYIIQRIGDVLKSLAAENPYLNLGYMGTESKMTVFNDEAVVEVIEGLEAFDVTSRPWYVMAKEAGKPIWTEPYIDANSGKLTLTCAAPVYHHDKTLVGVVGFDVLLDTIQKDILTLDIGYQSYAFLMNKKGNVLVRPGMKKKDERWDSTYKTEDLLKTNNPSFNQITKKMTKGRKGVETYTSEEGDRYIAYAPIQAINASMGIVALKNEVVRPATRIQLAILVFWVIVLVISIIVGLFLGNSITRPIKELTVMADLISQGKMDLEIMDESRKDEIGVLTKAFNRLVISLKLAMSRK